MGEQRSGLPALPCAWGEYLRPGVVAGRRTTGAAGVNLLLTHAGWEPRKVFLTGGNGGCARPRETDPPPGECVYQIIT